MYVIASREHGIIVDPYFSQESLKWVETQVKNVDYIFLTHEHFDHTSGVESFKKIYGSQIVCSRLCEQVIIRDKTRLHRECDILLKMSMKKSLSLDPLNNFNADIVFQGETAFIWENHNLIFFETPGHSMGSSCMLVDKAYLFVGDTLLSDKFTITKFPGGNDKLLEEITIPLLKKFRKNILVFPGHGIQFYLKDVIFRQWRNKK